jgi:hypothetical protein
MAMSPRLLRPRATGFNPKSISGLRLWLDAANTSSFTLNGSGVSQWSDGSGSGNHFVQATSNNQPSRTDTQNGKSVVTFDGSNDRLATASAISLGTGGYTVFIVGYHGGGFQVMLEGGGLNPYISSNSDSSIGFAHYDGAAALSSAAGTYSINTWFVLEYAISQSSRLISVNGTQVASGSGTSRTASIQYLGSSSGGFYWGGRFAEVLIYGSALSAQRSTIRKYLGSKWGITVA